ncbi:MAG: AAA family ATPase, partial [Kovacikia sp.]
ILSLSLAVAEESIQRRAVLYDKEGDAHFDTISAFIKSVRGSDPDAALYWLARMVYAGEDPRFIFRRLVILAGEDVGMADPNAIVVVNACAQAFDRVGMPEGRYPLAHATLYLATAPKSNSVMGFFDALSTIEQEREADVPSPLKDANRDKKSFGHGAGYLYPHAYRDHWVAQQYLPTSLQGQVFYQPSDQGYEAGIRIQVTRRREAQLAALVEGVGVAMPEILTFSTVDSAQERWLQRTIGKAGERLGGVRDRLFDLAPPQRHHLILNLNAGSGLLTWEAVRRVPEGGVYACVYSATDAAALSEQANALGELARPIILSTTLPELAPSLTSKAPDVQFDRIIGRNTLIREPAKAEILRLLVNWLQPDGIIALAEAIPRHAQRLYRLLDPTWLSASLYKKLTQAEEQIYTQPSDPMVNWDVADLQRMFETAGLVAEIQVEQTMTELLITSPLIDRWFTSASASQPSYATHLQRSLSAAEITKLHGLFNRLVNQTVPWGGAIAFIYAHP